MSAAFDRKFGEEFVARLPAMPGIYRVFDSTDATIYVGKAIHLRRRLSQYRNAKRRKKHHKMRAIIREAARIEIIECATHLEACLLETRLIQELRPKLNVANAFYFLYPMVGLRFESGTFSLLYTTLPEEHPGFQLHGAFRSREITWEAFYALVRLMRFIGHPIKRKGGPKSRRAFLFEFRQVPERWTSLMSAFFKGESKGLLEELILALVENAAARKSREEIQERLDELLRFWRHEATPLNRARKATALTDYPVPQKERDLLFLRYRIPPSETRSTCLKRDTNTRVSKGLTNTPSTPLR